MINDNLQQEKKRANFVGPHIRRFRAARGLSQAKFAARLQLSGLNIGREVLAQIEAQTHCIKDKDIIFFAHALKIDLSDLYFGNENGERSTAVLFALLQASFQPKHAQKVVMKSLQRFETKLVKHGQTLCMPVNQS